MLDNPSYEVKKRGFWLSTYLILSLISGLLGTLWVYFNAGSIIQIASVFDVQPRIEVADIYSFCAASLISLIFTIGIWFWKRWGVYGTYSTVLLWSAYNLLQGGSWVWNGGSIIAMLLIIPLFSKRWNYFR